MRVLTAILLAATLALTQGVVVVPDNDVLPGNPGSENPIIFARGRILQRHRCKKDSLVQALINDGKQHSEALPFCSSYIRPTSTSTSTVQVSSTTVVQTESTTVVVTLTLTSTPTPVVTCAVPPTGRLICGFIGFGYIQNTISSTDGVDPVTCHQNCLADPACRSFQVSNSEIGNAVCALYNVEVLNNVEAGPSPSPFIFYDRNCPYYLPAECASAGAKRKRNFHIPGSLATVDAARISFVCSCLVKTPNPTVIKTTVVTSTQTLSRTTTVTTTTTTTTIVPAMVQATNTVIYTDVAK